MIKKNVFIIVILFILAGISSYIIYNSITPNKDDSNAIEFSNEYSSVSEDNVFVYKTSSEIIKILSNGTGVVYLGFPECPWCMKYVTFINEMAKATGIEEVCYYNIKNDRNENNDVYLKIVDLLDDYLLYDELGNKRIYVPIVVAVNKGDIVGVDFETAADTKGYETPEEYWDNEDIDSFKNKLANMFSLANPNLCQEDCN